MAYAFTIVDESELRSLRWLAGRYESARFLLDCWNGDEGKFPQDVVVPEHVAWEVLDATSGDGAYRGIVPCLGGRLGEEIHEMLESVI
jgi:hypothetical protein